MRLVPRLLLVCLGVVNAGVPANWTADYPPCNQHSELLSQEHLNLAVRIATANPLLAKQFRRALDFWAGILDLDWHPDDSQSCSIQVVDGKPELFQPAAIGARSQLPNRLNFEGWIAFNPRIKLTEMELYRMSVHEIGHVLGLEHSSNPRSVMYGFELDGQESLDSADLEALAKHHKMRVATSDQLVKK